MARKTATVSKSSPSKQSPFPEQATALNTLFPFFSPRAWTYVIPPVFLSTLTTLFYYPSLWYPFQFDDLANITKNFHLRFYDISRSMFNNSRWIGELLNAFCFKIGRYNPFYYRLTNLFIHITSGVLLFYLIMALCRKNKSNSFLANNALTIAFITAGLFLLHPVQTQTVSYVIQARLEGLATLFVLATLFFFIRAMRTTSTPRSYLFTGLMFFTGFLACGTKEVVVVLPFLAILLDWFFIADRSWASFKQRLLLHAAFTLLIIGTISYYLDPSFLKEAVQLKLAAGNNRGNVLTDHALDVITPGHFLISQFKVVLHYLFMFLWPQSICVEYDWKLAVSFFAPDSFFPFLALVALGGTALYCAFKKNYAYISFGLLWFFVAVAPRSSIIPSSELICDYKTYLASIGWLFVLGVLLTKLITTRSNKTPFSSFFAQPSAHMFTMGLVCCLFGYASLQRNTVWKSPVAFWRDIVEKAPTKARGHNNLGVACAEQGKIDEAIACYQKAIRLDAYYTDPYNNIAVAYTHKNEIDKGIMALNQAIVLFPYYPEAYNNRGSLHLKKKDYAPAERDLRTAIKLRPYYGKAHYNLGRLYFEQQQEHTAWTHFKNATLGDLDTLEGFHTLGQISLRVKKFKEATQAFESMVATIQRTTNVPNADKILETAQFNLANAYFMDKQHDKSQQIYEYLSRHYPLDARYTHNLGETLYTKNEYQEGSGEKGTHKFVETYHVVCP